MRYYCILIVSDSILPNNTGMKINIEMIKTGFIFSFIYHCLLSCCWNLDQNCTSDCYWILFDFIIFFLLFVESQ